MKDLFTEWGKDTEASLPSFSPPHPIPLPGLRFKGDRLQQSFINLDTGRVVWRDVPQVAEDVSDEESYRP